MIILQINPKVYDDLLDIYHFIAEDNLKVADEVISSIYARLEKLRDFPDIGMDLTKKVAFESDYKYVIHKAYVILYKRTKESVQIYRIINCRRDVISLIFEDQME